MTPVSSVRGWCPGAYRPMMSGDGFIMRVRPFYARLEHHQVLGLCDLAQRFGNGFVDLTNRANLQIRGVAETRIDRLLGALSDLDLLDETPKAESRRNILVTPFWTPGDVTQKLTGELVGALARLPDLPAKFGFAVDTGTAPLLTMNSADIRIEPYGRGVLVRADGASLGRPVGMNAIIDAVVDLATWFATHRTRDDRRMTHVLARRDLPAHWTTTAPLDTGARPRAGTNGAGFLLGAAFGQLDAASLARLMQNTGATALRVTPWRHFLLEGVCAVADSGFITTPDDPLLRIDACPGAPFCNSATVETRALARRLAGKTKGSLHVSGCAKGCARKGRADTTIVGNQGRFDLVENGHAWDAPVMTGRRPRDVLAEMTDPL